MDQEVVRFDDLPASPLKVDEQPPVKRPRGRPRKVVRFDDLPASPLKVDEQPQTADEPIDDRMEILTATERFLDALGKVVHGMSTHGWQDWIAARCQPFRGMPPVPAYLKYRIVGVDMATRMEPYSRRVRLVLTLVPSGALPVREMAGSLRVIRESAAWAEDGQGDWRVVPISWQTSG